jgi:two-component system sensor kinase FixL
MKRTRINSSAINLGKKEGRLPRSQTSKGDATPPEAPSTAGPSLVAIYALLAFALLSLFGAAIGIYGGLNKLAIASNEVEMGYRRIAAAEDILSLARDIETAKRGFVLTGQTIFLKPYYAATNRAPAAWTTLERLTPATQADQVSEIGRTYKDFANLNAQTIFRRRTSSLPSAQLVADISAGRTKMELLRAQVKAYVDLERDHLQQLQREDDLAYRDAIVQALIGSLALILTGALLYAALREARREAGKSAALAEAAEQRFKATFEQSSLGILHLSPAGDPILVNDALCWMTGYTREEILTAEPNSPAYAATVSHVPDMEQAVVNGANHQMYAIYPVTRKDGTPLWVASVLSAVRGNDGQISFWTLFVRDMSEQRRAEQQLFESQDRMLRLQDEMAHIGRVNDLGEMATAIAHEVNQPLTAISNYMAVAQRLMNSKAEADRDLADILRRVGEQAVRAGQIIRRMRSFIERRAHAPSLENLDELIESAIELALLGLDKSRFKIQHYSGVAGIQLLVDPVQIQQILLILLRNAMEAIARADPETRVDIHILTEISPADAGQIAIHVKDNGPGISPEILSQLFQPFVTTKPGNLGMGLPIARRLAEQHGGKLENIASDQGGHFVVYLPLPNPAADA